MKLTRTQEEMINLMENGWELGKYSKWKAGSRVTLQEGGLGKGGKVKCFRVSTLWSLLKKSVIKSIGGYNPERYELTSREQGGE